MSPSEREPLQESLPGAFPETVPWEQVNRNTLNRPFGFYIHVPFCTSRCGYCDFNTYALSTYPGDDPIGTWVRTTQQEIQMGAQILAKQNLTLPPIDTVFFGGGTPSLLGERLGPLLETVRSEFGIADDAEITSEANPESTSPELFAAWRDVGVNRISLGMQSAQPHILHLLDREHSPQRATAAIQEAQAAGFHHLNLDLIYGTPGETAEDVARSLETVLETGVDHVSAYALTIEPGTALFRKVHHGDIAPIDEDIQAARYQQIDSLLQDAGFAWYEVSNWAKLDAQGSTIASRCRHNMGYWTGGNWWAVGAGAHGYLGGVRWSIRKNPRRYAEAMAAGNYPADWSEALTPEEITEEIIMLQLRVAEGLPAEVLTAPQLSVADQAVADGLATWQDTRGTGSPALSLVLTRRGRLLADRLITDLLVA